ncbi:MAG: glycosyltransferase family 39 protein [Muribaculaceae bacterium]|nr:glycosyltransferase family 39 protein [Muribaculaceae bacterium]
MTDKKKLLGIIVPAIIFIIAFILRILYINTSFWYDEACSWTTAIQNFPAGILQNLTSVDLQHTPLYFFVLHFWMKIFGDNEIAIRTLSFIFGLLTIPMVYIISNKLFKNNKILIIAASAISAVSPLLVLFSVEARMYSAVAFLVLLSLNFLIDFENSGSKKSAINLAIVNILIPYTLVGGILYNISATICYGIYLFNQNKKKFYTYLKIIAAEAICLIPYFVLVGYYAKMRNLFVIKHEGSFAFWQMVEVLRNFFATNLVQNPYWPSLSSYDMTPALVILIMVPGAYFLYGLVKGFCKSSGFIKTLYCILFVSFGLSVALAMLQINVFTPRYILYLAAPSFILAVYGLSASLTKKHLIAFCSFFIIMSGIFDVQYSKQIKKSKHLAFAAVQDEAANLGLTNEDMVIAPFGSDAPYYFRKNESVRVHNFDFHKEVRNPYNEKYYDKSQQNLMDKKAKYGVIYDAVFSDLIFSKNFFEFFNDNVINNIDSGRFLIIALYDSDGENVVPLEELRKSVTDITAVKNHTVEIMLKKYLYDIVFLIERDFDLVNMYKKDNYTYILYRKK